MTRARALLRSVLLAVVGIGVLGGPLATPAEAQTTTMPSTLRYGSGLLDVPVASVIPHLAVVGSYSGFALDLPGRVRIGPDGQPTGRGAPVSQWLSDAAVTVGIADRAEVGATFQSFAGEGSGGDLWGGFGRFLLLDPVELDGLGLAVGGRWLTSPSFEGGPAQGVAEPGRLGSSDDRLRSTYTGDTGGVDTNFSPYVVASALLPGFDLRYVPDHDFTFVVGRGGGMFSQGGHLPWYGSGPTEGWFYGTAVHVELRNHLLLDLMAEHNAFEVNLGAQLDMGGVRVGAFLLGSDYEGKASAYRSTKWGLSASIAVCPDRGGLCGPELRDRNVPDTIQLPAPPPDTIVVEPDRTGALPGAPGSNSAAENVVGIASRIVEGGGGEGADSWSAGLEGPADRPQGERCFSTMRFVALRVARAAPRAVASSAQA